jgi:hypothetical protein
MSSIATPLVAISFFSGIPTFVDGRALPLGDAFIQKSIDTEYLVDITRACSKRALEWVFSDEYSVVFLRRR